MFALLFSAITSAFAQQQQPLPADVRITDQGDRIVLSTEQGSKTLIGGYDFSKLPDYKIQMKISDLNKQNQPLMPQFAPQAMAQQPQPPPSAAHSVAPPVSAVQKPAPGPDTAAMADEVNALYFEGRYAEALSRADRLLEADPNHARGWLMRGSLLQTLGRQAEAKLAWARAKEIESGNKQ